MLAGLLTVTTIAVTVLGSVQDLPAPNPERGHARGVVLCPDGQEKVFLSTCTESNRIPRLSLQPPTPTGQGDGMPLTWQLAAIWP
jgi:hypothetical protein